MFLWSILRRVSHYPIRMLSMVMGPTPSDEQVSIYYSYLMNNM